MWIICFFIATAILVFSLGYPVRLLFDKKKTGKIFNPFHVLAVGVAVSAFLYFLPFYFSVLEQNGFRVFKGILLALHNVIRLFVIDFNYFEFLQMLPKLDGWVQTAYSVAWAVVCVIAPLLTFGAILSLFKNLTAKLKFFTSYFKDAYVFSELNEKSIALAADVKANHKKAILVFADVFEKNEERAFELVKEAKDLGAVCFKTDLMTLNLKHRAKTAQTRVFIIGENESENVEQALRVLATYGDVKNAHLYVFSTRLESELLIAAAKKDGMKVRRINEARSLINSLLYDDGKKIFENAIAVNEKEKLISAIVVGLGRHGTEIIKALLWFCQMDGYRVEINAFDKDPLAEEKFIALCPEIMSEKYNGVYIDGESQYFVKIHSGADVATSSFADKITALKNVTYAFVSLGRDDLNVQTAVNLRMLFERSGQKPRIQAIVYNSIAKEILSAAQNHAGQPYGIECIGDLKTCYSERIVINSELEQKALERHLKYGVEDTFWRYEYNYRSSVASAIHMKLRQDLKIPGADKAEKDLTKEEIAVIEPLEHRRWNAYMRTEGFVYSGTPYRESRNDLGKLHHNLVDFNTLSEKDKRKDRSVGSK